MSSIIRPDKKPESKKNVIIDAEPAVIVHRNQLKAKEDLKTEVAQEIEKRKKITEVTTDEEFAELYEMVNELITKQDFWQLPTSVNLKIIYAFIAQELVNRNETLPSIPALTPAKKTTKKEK